MLNSFLVRILIQKGNTEDNILENKFYTSESKNRKEKKDKVSVKESSLNFRRIGGSV